MKIQEKMVKLLNEESWDDVICNYQIQDIQQH